MSFALYLSYIDFHHHHQINPFHSCFESLPSHCYIRTRLLIYSPIVKCTCTEVVTGLVRSRSRGGPRTAARSPQATSFNLGLSAVHFCNITKRLSSLRSQRSDCLRRLLYSYVLIVNLQRGPSDYFASPLLFVA
jgi:hypothetical protein